jgi:rfaE bifunctional protein nucleotidyltransferase chain/domain
MIKILKNIIELRKIRDKKKKIALCHGVFDLVHPGHLEHFNEAKKICDILVVSITSDKYANKGFGKPVFDENLRSFFLSNIKLVDFVFINQAKSSLQVIENLKPNFYIKGPDYSKKKNDIAGNLEKEKLCVEKFGGKLILTKGKTFSSSSLLNQSNLYENSLKITHPEIFINNKLKINIKKNYQESIKKLKKKKILVLGEVILDKYIFCEPLGKPSKESIISVNFNNEKIYLGGVLPIAKIMNELSDNVTLVSCYKSLSLLKKIKKSLSRKIKTKLFYCKEYQDIYKTRFVQGSTINKIFEYYKYCGKPIDDRNLIEFLKKNLSKFDLILVADFGHGVITKNVIKELTKSKKISVNVQTNSGNRGFNLFKKYNKSFFLCIDEPEFRLGMSDKFSNLKDLILNKSNKNYKKITITRGINGSIYYDKLTKELKIMPAFNNKTKDTIGAGDTLFAYTSAFHLTSKSSFLPNLVGSIAASLKTNIVGHERIVQENEVFTYLNYLIK